MAGCPQLGSSDCSNCVTLHTSALRKGILPVWALQLANTLTTFGCAWSDAFRINALADTRWIKYGLCGKENGKGRAVVAMQGLQDGALQRIRNNTLLSDQE
jgi:hypothetical protein